MIKHKHHIIFVKVLICFRSVVQADSNNYNYFKYGYFLLYDNKDLYDPCIDVRVDGNAVYRQFIVYCDGRESKNFNFI